jgi:putative transposase
VDRRLVRHQSTRPDDGVIRKRLRELANERRRFEFRRLGYLLKREGIHMNHKKLLRLYREEGLAVCRRRGRKRALGTRAPMGNPGWPKPALVAGLCFGYIHRWQAFSHSLRGR